MRRTCWLGKLFSTRLTREQSVVKDITVNQMMKTFNWKLENSKKNSILLKSEEERYKIYKDLMRRERERKKKEEEDMLRKKGLIK